MWPRRVRVNDCTADPMLTDARLAREGDVVEIAASDYGENARCGHADSQACLLESYDDDLGACVSVFGGRLSDRVCDGRRFMGWLWPNALASRNDLAASMRVLRDAISVSALRAACAALRVA